MDMWQEPFVHTFFLRTFTTHDPPLQKFNYIDLTTKKQFCKQKALILTQINTNTIY